MELQEFATREEASIAAAQRIASAIQRSLSEQSGTRVVVTGGSSPLKCYEQLAQTDIDWGNVHLLLSDERWIPANHPDSNEKLVRDCLLTGKAAGADLLPFYDADMSVEDRSDFVTRTLAGMESPAACALLGMGDDGHFASLFPDAGNLQVGLQADSSIYCIPVKTAASPYQRISLTLSALLKSDELLLLCFGDAKRTVLEQASRGIGEFPVAHLLAQTQVPVTTYWAP